MAAGSIASTRPRCAVVDSNANHDETTAAALRRAVEADRRAHHHSQLLLSGPAAQRRHHLVADCIRIRAATIRQRRSDRQPRAGRVLRARPQCPGGLGPVRLISTTSLLSPRRAERLRRHAVQPELLPVDRPARHTPDPDLIPGFPLLDGNGVHLPAGLDQLPRPEHGHQPAAQFHRRVAAADRPTRTPA